MIHTEIPTFLSTVAITMAIQLLFFSIAYTFQIDTFTDLAGTTNFAIISVYTYNFSEKNSRSKLITACVCLWALRLGGFLFYRVTKLGHDGRFDVMRQRFFRFLRFWVAQMVWVTLGTLPVYLANSSSSFYNLGTKLDYIGLILFIFGFVIETIADTQKFYDKLQRKDNLQLINIGLWRYSRHPNYFGEILLWWGIFILSISSNQSWTCYYGILSPLFTMFILLRLSGIPYTEPKIDQKILREGNQEQKDAYLDYLNCTSPIIPLPNSFYRNLPISTKRVFFFEFESYRFNEVKEALIQRN